MNTQSFFKKQRLIAACTCENINKALTSDADALLLMNGTLSFFIKYRKVLKECPKPLFIHLDLIKGLSNDIEAIHFLKKYCTPTGIVSTKGMSIKAAKKEGLLAIQRIFLIDSNSLHTAMHNIKVNKPDIVEIMPGIAPNIVPILKQQLSQPIILGGLIWTEEQVKAALHSQVEGISLSKEKLWNQKIMEGV
ncbi:glycerol-3-phosphate responsive antiterminator [Bacillus bingmayongensis]|uniref:Glycerol uptake operon antiterminator regulatory protein n=1 Tax=Bacillus bingmayongensis TaxID=1150157 RepID=A0ABU5JTX1_9BACI|nr:glycerol-3-phosphate responsive antiterminator [Bacillus bingmayongensis]MBY0596428.1 glycerol-3-phosphate responsive antiterminator [Bacillus bingmayongensis]MDZ5606888.1 glycerol-3-phosphate responsive antiterminator [Bacillus pseudomycoides]